MRRALHLFLVVVTLWRALAGDAMAMTWQQGQPSGSDTVVSAGTVANLPCHEAASAAADTDAGATQLSGGGHGGCAACAVCHLGALLAAPVAVTVTPPSMAVNAASVPQWHSASLARAVKPPIL
jgi:hypothetical protein